MKLIVTEQLRRKMSRDTQSRVISKNFDPVGHKTMYASSGNKHFFTKSCHHHIRLGDQLLLENVFEIFDF